MNTQIKNKNEHNKIDELKHLVLSLDVSAALSGVIHCRLLLFSTEIPRRCIVQFVVHHMVYGTVLYFQ